MIEHPNCLVILKTLASILLSMLEKIAKDIGTELATRGRCGREESSKQIGHKESPRVLKPHFRIDLIILSWK